QKRRSALAANDTMDSWTFGIITNGKRKETMEEILQSIHQQNIPNYEIIVCGTYFDRKEKNFRYIHFSEYDDKGWITKKKNLICEAACYENLIIIHDRIIFKVGWYKGMKQFGNYFDALSCIQVLNNNLRSFDWYTKPPNLQAPPVYNSLLRATASKGVPRNEMGLHYDDWDPFVVMNGGLTILKRSLWRVVPWDENRFWNDAEDVDISHRIYQNGGVIRFNPYSRCETAFWRHSLISLAKRDPKRLGVDFDTDPLPYVIYNAKYYLDLRLRRFWYHTKKHIKIFLSSKNAHKMSK
ncbi:hypothetical protein KA005_85615, partial [bacterium]|nr:hypothetical protein [bacterium]